MFEIGKSIKRNFNWKYIYTLKKGGGTIFDPEIATKLKKNILKKQGNRSQQAVICIYFILNTFAPPLSVMQNLKCH